MGITQFFEEKNFSVLSLFFPPSNALKYNGSFTIFFSTHNNVQIFFPASGLCHLALGQCLALKAMFGTCGKKQEIIEGKVITREMLKKVDYVLLFG